MARRKLPLLTERSLAEMRADRLEFSMELTAKLGRVSCTKGCSSCCRYPVYISILEGMQLYRSLTEHGHWTPALRKKLEQHADQTFELAAQVWLLLDLPCPLLDKDKCMAYEDRPFTCRALYAKSDPYNCHPHRVTNARFVDRDAVQAKFRAAETKILGRHKLGLLGMPISKAVLLGEKIITGDADLEHFLSVAIASLPQ